MHRIDTSRATGGNLFQGGDPDVGLRATAMDADWCNAVQEEIAMMIEGAGVVLVKGTNTQLLAAINKLITIHVPLLEGKELHTTLYDATRYQMPNGQSLLRADWPEAWAAIQTSGQLAANHAAWLASPTLWGPGVDSDHFNMKDLRDVFTRIDKDGKVGALGPALGGFKANQNKAHSHDLPQAGSGANETIISDNEPSQRGPKATSSSGGDEAVPDHTSLRYVIRMK